MSENEKTQRFFVEKPVENVVEKRWKNKRFWHKIPVKLLIVYSIIILVQGLTKNALNTAVFYLFPLTILTNAWYPKKSEKLHLG